jgi:dTDP-4-amino-4,6-dideoxygalactose transaminase
VQATRKQALRRLDRLRRIPDVVAFDDAVGDEGVWPFLLLLMPSEKARDVALKELWTAGLGVSRLFIHALPDYGYLRDIVAPAALPRARDFAARSLTIGNSLWLRDDEFARICSALERAVTASRQ